MCSKMSSLADKLAFRTRQIPPPPHHCIGLTSSSSVLTQTHNDLLPPHPSFCQRLPAIAASTRPSSALRNLNTYHFTEGVFRNTFTLGAPSKSDWLGTRGRHHIGLRFGKPGQCPQSSAITGTQL